MVNQFVDHFQPFEAIESASGSNSVGSHVTEIDPIANFKRREWDVFSNHINTVTRWTKESTVIQNRVKGGFLQWFANRSGMVVNNIIEVAIHSIGNVVLSLFDSRSFTSFFVSFFSRRILSWLPLA